MVRSVGPVGGGCAAPDGIRAIVCCDQIVHPISDDAPALIGCNAP